MLFTAFLPIPIYIIEEGENPVFVTRVTLNKTSLTLERGSTSQLTATVSPAGATNKAVT
jgi:uncharacterized protein YjdB